MLSMTGLMKTIPLRLSLSKPFHRLFTLRLFDRLTSQGERPIDQNENGCWQLIGQAAEVVLGEDGPVGLPHSEIEVPGVFQHGAGLPVAAKLDEG